MNEKRFELYYSKSKKNWYVRDTTGEIKCVGCADPEVAEYICNEWNNLHGKNKWLELENERLKNRIADKGVQLDFLKAENEHMREVLDENKELNVQVKSKEKVIQALEDYIEILKEEGVIND